MFVCFEGFVVVVFVAGCCYKCIALTDAMLCVWMYLAYIRDETAIILRCGAERKKFCPGQPDENKRVYSLLVCI